MLGGGAKVPSGNPTLLSGSENCDQSERGNWSHPPDHFRAGPHNGGGFRSVIIGDDQDRVILVNCRPGSVLQESRLSDQGGHIKDIHQGGEKDDKETEADEAEEHGGGHLGSRVQVLGEERAATVVVVERETGVKDCDYSEGQGNEPGYKQGRDRWKDGWLTPESLHKHESVILDDEIWTGSSGVSIWDTTGLF